jgi:hypothetical protein
MKTQGRSLELFFIDGRPEGMLTAEVFNWTGHVLRIPRTQLKEGLARPEATYTGVYVLLGDKEGEACAYVGEAEDMRERIRDHAAKKDWWDSAILITTSANNLHKAHVKYLESRLVEIAKDVRATGLENGNTPPRPSLNEAALSNMESFLETLMMVLPAIRVDNFLSRKRATPPQDSSAPRDDVIFEMKVPKHNIHATAILHDGEMILQKGSIVRKEWAGDRKTKTHYYKIFDELLEAGIIVAEGSNGVVTQDYAFSSPSAAAAISAGRSANGRTSWRKQGSTQTYGEWEDAALKEQTE